jgi:hypothetical protein
MEHLEVISGPSVVQTGSTIVGSASVSGLTTSALWGALGVTGDGIPPGTYVQTIDSGSQVTLTQKAITTGSATLTFALEPITLAEAKLHCRVEIPEDDALIAGLVPSARMVAEVIARQTFLPTTYDWHLDGFPMAANGYFNRLVRAMGPSPAWLPNGAAVLQLPKPPVISVTSVSYSDSTGNLAVYPATSYVLAAGTSGRLQPLIGQVWPVLRPQIEAVVIRYTAGYPTVANVPEVVKSALKLLVSHWYENREATVAASYGSKEIPQGVDRLLGSLDGWSYA